MKIFSFGENDNIYKIFEVLNKINPKKTKEIFLDIHPKNEFFSNKWWVKLVVEKAQDVGVKPVFIISNSKQEKLLKLFNLNYVWKKEPLHTKIRNIIFDFVNFIKVSNFGSKYSTTFKFAIIFAEVALVIFGIYFVYNLVVPKTDIYIQPAVKIKHLVQKFYITNQTESLDSKLPVLNYYTGEFTKVISAKLPVKNIKYISQPAYGVVEFYNYSAVGYSLKSHTQLITKDGLIFRLKNWVYVPPAKGKSQPGTAKVEVIADMKDVNGNLIGERGNILAGTKLFVRKLYVSIGKKKLYAIAVKDFTNGMLNSSGVVSLDDIQNMKNYLSGTLHKNIQKLIKSYMQQNFPDDFPLLYSGLYFVKNIKYTIQGKPGDKLAFLNGTLQADIKFFYIKKSDIKRSFKQYLMQHIVVMSDFLGWNDASLDILNFKKIYPNFYQATINFDALLGYDFSTDYNHIKDQIINQIVGLSISQAKKIILSYPEVATVEIKTTNNFDTISNLKSRIFIHIVK